MFLGFLQKEVKRYDNDKKVLNDAATSKLLDPYPCLKIPQTQNRI